MGTNNDGRNAVTDQGTGDLVGSQPLAHFDRTRLIWDANVSTHEAFLLFALNSFVDGYGRCFPGTKRLAQMTKMSERTVRRTISQLCDRGILHKQSRWTEEGRTAYTINFHALPKSQDKKLAKPQSKGYRRNRAKVLERDNYQCVYCGSTEDLTLDHVVPRSQGGRGTMQNLVTACRTCNSSKNNRTPDEWRRGAA